MVASRNRPKGFRIGPFGLCAFAFSVLPTPIGYQDLAALLVRQQDVAHRARAHALASPFGTIHAATFSFPRPVGTLIPEHPLRPVRLDLGDVTSSIDDPYPESLRAVRYPTVNRELKGDRLGAPRPEPVPSLDNPRDLTPGRIKTVSFPRPADLQARIDEPAEDQPQADNVLEPEAAAETPAPGDLTALPPAEAVPQEPGPAQQAEAPAEYQPEPDEQQTVANDIDAEPSLPVRPPVAYSVASLPPLLLELPPKTQDQIDAIDSLDPSERASRLFFGGLPVGNAIGTIEQWPSEQMLVMLPLIADPEIKRSALAPLPQDDGKPGMSVAPKGEVTGPNQRPMSPAERLGLKGKDRAKAERCLAEAIYFESRGEPKRGQVAVAQVVMNRVFSGYYPNNVCEVVYQNAHRYNACQFTFACDSVKDVVNDPPLWKQAMEISSETLDGKLWLEDIGKSTHYHAYWVHPWWVGTMRKLSRIGVHTFYRPKRWGDGADAPIWGPGMTSITPQNAKL